MMARAGKAATAARQIADEKGFAPIEAKPVPRPWRFVSAILVAILAALLLWSVATNPNFRWDVVGEYWNHPRILAGVRWTLALTVAAMAIAVVLAVTLAIMRRSSNPVMRTVSWVYIWFFRGTPIYTQLVFWGLFTVLYPQLFGVPTRSFYDPAMAAIIGLSLNEAAYLSEIVRSGLNAVDKGQGEAARALGMRESRIMRRIILPQAMRVIIPPTGNETISMLKTTSLVLAVPFTLDLTFTANQLGTQTYLPVPMLVVAALWYLVITSILMVGQHFLEQHFAKGFAERKGRTPTTETTTDTEPGVNVPAFDTEGRPIGGPPRADI